MKTKPNTQLKKTIKLITKVQINIFKLRVIGLISDQTYQTSLYRLNDIQKTIEIFHEKTT